MGLLMLFSLQTWVSLLFLFFSVLIQVFFGGDWREKVGGGGSLVLLSVFDVLDLGVPKVQSSTVPPLKSSRIAISERQTSSSPGKLYNFGGFHHVRVGRITSALLQ